LQLTGKIPLKFDFSQVCSKKAVSPNIKNILALAFSLKLNRKTYFFFNTFVEDLKFIFYIFVAYFPASEGCLSSSANALLNVTEHKNTTRQLLIFTTSAWNRGTADFRPWQTSEQWEFHQCHK